VRTLAGLLEVPVERVAEITAQNARRLFGLDRVAALGPGRIVYPLKNALYLNLTNRCTLACSFCLKHRGHRIGEHSLALQQEPTAAQVIAALQEALATSRPAEVVFCGIGEPLLRLTELLAVGRWLKQQGLRVRVNTDGLANLVHGRDVVPDLVGVVDAIRVSLNAHEATSYARLCRPPDPERAFMAVGEFIRRCAALLPEVVATAVQVPGVQPEQVRTLAESMGARFQLRPYLE
jgi:TatD DNase family protein